MYNLSQISSFNLINLHARNVINLNLSVQVHSLARNVNKVLYLYTYLQSVFIRFIKGHMTTFMNVIKGQILICK